MHSHFHFQLRTDYIKKGNILVDDNIQKEFETMKKQASGEAKPPALIELKPKKNWKKFFAVDFSDVWNWVLLAFAIALLIWGTTSIYSTLTNWGV